MEFSMLINIAAKAVTKMSVPRLRQIELFVLSEFIDHGCR
jgi:hypothetical protein